MINIFDQYIEINNCRQNLMIMSSDDSNPVLLIVHGGAGCPDRPLVKKFSKELAGYYTVVCWDQRGGGFSYTNKPLSVELLLSDLECVVEHLRKKYHKEKIYIAGHSWGAYLGLRFVDRHPEMVEYYIGTGQVISIFQCQRDKYRYVMEQAKKRDRRLLTRFLESTGEPEGKDFKKHRLSAGTAVLLLTILYAGYFSHAGPSAGRYASLYLKLYSECYGRDIGKFLLGAVKSYFSLNLEMERRDSISPITELKVPVLLISGEEDMVCPVPAVQRWFEKLNAPKKEFVIIKNAAHMVNFEKPDEWNALLKGLLRQD